MFFEKNELKLLWPFYLDAVLLNMFYIFPAFYIVYFRDIGLSIFQIGLLTSIASLASIIFEVPTGAIADIFGRKFSTILGLFLSGVSILLIPFFKDFYALLVIFFIWSMVSTLISGAKDAWIVDLVVSKGNKKIVENYYIKKDSFFSFSFVISGIIGAIVVGKFGLSIVWIVSGIYFILNAFIFLFAKESFSRIKKSAREHYSDLIEHAKKSVKYSLNHKVISKLLLISMIIAFFVAFGSDIIWYPMLQNYGLKDAYFGYLFSATFVLGIFTPHLIKSLAKKVGGYTRYIILVLIVMMLVLFSVSFTKNLILTLALFVFYCTTWDLLNPARSILFQNLITKKMRATITSLESMIMSLGGIISFALAGFLADIIGSQNALIIAGVLIIPIIYIMFKIKNERIIKEKNL